MFTNRKIQLLFLSVLLLSFFAAIAGSASERTQPLTSFSVERLSNNYDTSSLPDVLNQETVEARVVTFNSGLAVNICWCYGVKTLIFPSDELLDFEVSDDETLAYSKLPNGSIRITDGVNFTAVADGSDYTLTVTRNGMTYLRSNSEFIYVYPEGEIWSYRFADMKWSSLYTEGAVTHYDSSTPEYLTYQQVQVKLLSNMYNLSPLNTQTKVNKFYR